LKGQKGTMIDRLPNEKGTFLMRQWSPYTQV
jgi:hypothetical protein